jgi:hypothetical protein
MARVQAYGIVPEQYQAYADRRWGRAGRSTDGRAQAWNELERYGNDPQGYLTRSRARCNWPRGEDGMIRIAHFSDLHYGTKNLAEADRCFGAAIDRAIALGAEAAVLSGDATDHGLDLHAPAAERLVAQVRRLADHCPVLMLQGHSRMSHRAPWRFSAAGRRHPVHVAERIEQVALTAQGRMACFDQLVFR